MQDQQHELNSSSMDAADKLMVSIKNIYITNKKRLQSQLHQSIITISLQSYALDVSITFPAGNELETDTVSNPDFLWVSVFIKNNTTDIIQLTSTQNFDIDELPFPPFVQFECMPDNGDNSLLPVCFILKLRCCVSLYYYFLWSLLFPCPSPLPSLPLYFTKDPTKRSSMQLWSIMMKRGPRMKLPTTLYEFLFVLQIFILY